MTRYWAECPYCHEVLGHSADLESADDYQSWGDEAERLHREHYPVCPEGPINTE